MVIHELSQDLFKIDPSFKYVHCISSDFITEMDIPKEHVSKVIRKSLMDTYPVAWDGHGYCLFTPMDGCMGAFNLVIKEYPCSAPTYTTLSEALYGMKMMIPRNMSMKVAMPHIGCASGLNWIQVEEMIKEVFENTELDIYIYQFCKPNKVNFKPYELYRKTERITA